MKWLTMSTVLLPNKKRSPVPPSSRSIGKFSRASSSTSPKKPNRNVKLVVIAGIALPLIAAIIGVVAWAISADYIHRSPTKKSRHSEQYLRSANEEYIDVLESRNDLDQSSNHIFNSYSRAEPVSGERERLLGKDPDKEDPLYVVHFVPSPSSVDSDDHKDQHAPPSTKISSAGDDEAKKLLHKIMAASKKDNPGVPQFVVFASLPGSQDSKQINGSNSTKQVLSSSTHNSQEQFEYEYEYVGVGDHSKIKKFIEPGEGVSKSDNIQNNVQLHQQSNIQNMHHMNPHSPISNPAPIQHQPQIHDASLRYPHPSQVIIPPPPPPPQQQHHYIQPNDQQYPPPQQQQQQHHYIQPNDQQYPPPHIQPGEPDRSGIELPPLGLKLSLGNGGHGKSYGLGGGGGGSPLGLKFSLGGGNDHGHGYGHGGGLSFSPLGIMATILKPLLPRPKAHLNGKVMFGVMLENGLKLGEKRYPPHPHYP